MKLKTLAILAMGIFGYAFASAQTFSFGTAIGGEGLYCNYEQLKYYGGGLWAGLDNLSACGVSVNATLSGFTASISAATGAQAHGKGVVYGDDIYAAYNGDPFAQWTVFTKLKCNKLSKFGGFVGPNGWEGVAAFSGFLAGTNYGPLSCSIPGRNGVAPTLGVATGALRRQAEKR